MASAYLPIGDFARATQISVRMLRHYHQIGLLTPAESDPQTGYRRYTTEQIPRAQVIRRFRDLEMPLETRAQFAQLVGRLAEDLACSLRERHLGAGLVRLRLSDGGRPCFARAAGGARQVDEAVWTERLARLPTPTDSAVVILETAARLGEGPGIGGAPDEGGEPEGQPPDWLELALGNLGPLVGRQAGLFEGQRLKRTQAAQAVDELAARFRGRLQAPAFGQSASGA